MHDLVIFSVSEKLILNIIKLNVFDFVIIINNTATQQYSMLLYVSISIII